MGLVLEHKPSLMNALIGIRPIFTPEVKIQIPLQTTVDFVSGFNAIFPLNQG